MKECNRKLLSELPMASSQSVQTLKNSRQRAGRQGGKVPGGREGKKEEGGALLEVCCQREKTGTHEI